MKQKLLSVLLVAVLLFSIMPTALYAAEPPPAPAAAAGEPTADETDTEAAPPPGGDEAAEETPLATPPTGEAPGLPPPPAEAEDEGLLFYNAAEGGEPRSVGAIPAGETAVGQVFVSIEDTVPTPDGEDWPAPRGLMAEGWVDIYPSDTAMDAIVRFANGKGLEVKGAESNYINEIDGLAAFGRGGESGWMITLNDWFGNEGYAAFQVADGTLAPNDTLAVLFTTAWGSDIGSGWDNNTKTLAGLEIEGGSLSPAFDGATHQYTLTPQAAGVKVVPTAFNKNFQVRATVNGTTYKRTETIPAQPGTVITLTVGDPAWPTMNAEGKTVPAEVYTLAVPEEAEPVAPSALTVVAPAEVPYSMGGYSGCYLYFNGTTPSNQFTLSASAEPAGASTEVTWASNQSYATIDENGVVTVAMTSTTSAQYVTFTATSKLDGEVKAQLSVYLLPEMYMYNNRNSVELTLAGVPVQDGSYLMVQPGTYGDYGALQWAVANPALAELVPSGSVFYVKGLCPGTTELTITNKYFPEKQLTIPVHIKGVIVQPTQAGAELRVTAGKSLAFEALGESDEEVFTWASSDEAVATVDENGLVTGHKEGVITLTATSSAEGKPAGSRQVLVARADDAPYLDELQVTNYSTWDGLANATDYFGRTTFAYSLISKNPSATTMTLNLRPMFDAEKYSLTYSYTQNGEAVEVAGAHNATTNIPMAIGENAVTVCLAELEDPENKTEYTFDVFRKRNTAANLKGMTLLPEDRVLAASPLINGQKEGIFFKLAADGSLTTGTGVAAATKNYRVFLYADIEKALFSATATDIGAHLRARIGDGEPFDIDSGITLDALALAGEETLITIEVCSDEKYYQNQQAIAEGGQTDTTDPFEAEDTYTLTIQRVAPGDEALAGAMLKSLDVLGGEFCTPAFNPELPYTAALVPNDTTTATLVATAAEGAEVYKSTSTTEANKVVPDENGNYTFAVNLGTSASATQAITVQTTIGGLTYKSNYTITLYRRGTPAALAGMPDAVVDFMCVGSQYTNATTYGLYPERIYGGGNGWSTPISVGNYGGYITLYYENAITNDPSNPYGIDFTVYGNSGGGQGMSEPANVYVSADGENWYLLAGSDHYDDNAVWNYGVTYIGNPDGTASYVDSNGVTGNMYKYPQPENYPLYNWQQGAEGTLSVRSTLLSSDATDPYGSKAAAFPAFGYADVHSNGSGTGVGNPYAEGYDKYGDGFDLAWAVDATGKPVKLDAVHYVKVETASFINAGMIGEKSAEVNRVVRTAGAADVGVTPAPAAIKVNGAALALKDGVTEYNAETGEGAFNIEVEAAEGANVYINNARGASRSFEAIPREGLVRIIVQQGQAAPAIYLLNLYTELPNTLPALREGVEPGVTLSIAKGKVFSTNLSDIFFDADGDALEYKVKINTFPLTDCPETFSMGATQKGTMTFVFTATDGKATSESYTVTLEVSELMSADETKALMDKIAAFQLENTQNPAIGTSNGDWTVLGLARGGYLDYDSDFVQTYLANATTMVIEKQGNLNKWWHTENARAIMGLSSVGVDVRDIGGFDMTAPLASFEHDNHQGINATIYVLIALDTMDYPIPQLPEGYIYQERDTGTTYATQATRERLVQQILSKASATGGWNYWASPSSDMTGMALQALAPYYGVIDGVKEVVDKALGKLSAIQTQHGGWDTCEGTVQMMVALNALGIPLDDARFVKNGNTPLDDLMRYYLPDKSAFEYNLGSGKVNGMTTDQAMYALTSYYRTLTGQNRLYDMTDTPPNNADERAERKAIEEAMAALPSPLGIKDKQAVTLLAERLRKLADFSGKDEMAATLAAALETIEAIEAKVAQLDEDIWNKLDPKNITLAGKSTVNGLMATYNGLAKADRAYVTNAQSLLDAKTIVDALEGGIIHSHVFRNLKGHNQSYSYSGSGYTLRFNGRDVGTPANMNAGLTLGSAPSAGNMPGMMKRAWWFEMAAGSSLPAKVTVQVNTGLEDGNYVLYHYDTAGGIVRIGTTRIAGGSLSFATTAGGCYFVMAEADAQKLDTSGGVTQEFDTDEGIDESAFKAIQGKNINVRLSGSGWSLTFNGQDIVSTTAFNATVRFSSPHADAMAKLAENPFVFGFDYTGTLPGKMLVQLSTALADGEYLLFRYDAATQTVVPVQRVTVSGGTASFFLSSIDGDYLLAKRASSKSLDELGDEEVVSLEDGEVPMAGLDGAADGTYDVADANLVPNSNQNTGFPWLPVGIAVVVLAAAAVIALAIARRRKAAKEGDDQV